MMKNTIKGQSPFRAKRGNFFMAEETTNPEQAAPAEAVPEEAAAPAADPAAAMAASPAAPAAPAAPDKTRKGNSLLVFLTALLILVGVVDVVLWGVAGYYLLRNAGNGMLP